MLVCLHCSNDIPSGRKFCSKSCAASFNNKKYPKRKKEGTCKGCGLLCNTDHRYCSDNCRIIHKPGSIANPKKNISSWRKRIKVKLVEYKGGKCVRCGYNKCNGALQFHHLDPSKKDFGISGMTKSFENLKKEVDKCILLCSNCHAEEHWL